MRGIEGLYSAAVIFGGGKEDRVAASATLERSRTLLGIQWAAKPPLQMMNDSIQRITRYLFLVFLTESPAEGELSAGVAKDFEFRLR